MVQGISFSNFNVGFGKNVRKLESNPSLEILDKLKGAGIPEDVISKGKAAVEKFAKDKGIVLPKHPERSEGVGTTSEHPKGSKLRGAEHANEHSALNKPTSDAIKSIMDENLIVSTGNLKEDMATIKKAIIALDVDAGKVLREKFQSLGLRLEKPEILEGPKDICKGAECLAMMNKHFLLNKKKAL